MGGNNGPNNVNDNLNGEAAVGGVGPGGRGGTLDQYYNKANADGTFDGQTQFPNQQNDGMGTGPNVNQLLRQHSSPLANLPNGIVNVATSNPSASASAGGAPSLNNMGASGVDFSR